ncbi:MAG: EamA family transporter [Acidimicrobiia bacterium]|nr:MAG: EamA family transporter [Acidimicrobiia bacterium]
MSSSLAVASALFYGFSDFAGGYVTRRLSVWTVIAWSQLLGLALVAAGVLVVPASSVTRADLLWGAVGGLAGLIGLVLLYLALARGTMMIAAPISGAVTASIPVLADVVAGPGLSTRQALGIGLAIGAILLVGLQHGIGGLDRRSLLYAVIAGVLFGIFFLALSRTEPASGLWPLVAARAISVPIAFAVAVSRGVAAPPRLENLGFVAVAGNLDMAANITGALALQRGPAGVTAVLISLYPAVTATLAMFVLRERPTRLQLLGVVLALGAVIALVG